MAKRKRTVVRDPRKVAAERDKVLTFGDQFDTWSIKESQLTKIKKQMRDDLSYMKRHGVAVDDEFLQTLTDADIALRWNASYKALERFAKEPAKVQEKERIKAVAEWFAFPDNLSRAKVKAISVMAEATGQNAGYADILRGDVSWEAVNAFDAELERQGVSPQMRKFAVSQKYFGSP